MTTTYSCIVGGIDVEFISDDIPNEILDEDRFAILDEDGNSLVE